MAMALSSPKNRQTSSRSCFIDNSNSVVSSISYRIFNGGGGLAREALCLMDEIASTAKINGAEIAREPVMYLGFPGPVAEITLKVPRNDDKARQDAVRFMRGLAKSIDTRYGIGVPEEKVPAV